MEMMMASEKNIGSLYSKLPENPVVYEGRSLKHRVPAREERRLVIEVDVIPTNGVVLGGQHVPTGKQTLCIYETQLKDVEALVMPPEMVQAWARSERTYLSQLEAHVQNMVGKAKDHRPEAYARERERAIETYGESTPSKLFEQEYPKANRPLRSCEVKDRAPAPETAETRQRTQIEGAMSSLANAILAAANAPKNKRAEAG